MISQTITLPCTDSAYALLDQSFKDYRRKLKELYGDEADKKVIEALAVEKSQTVYSSQPVSNRFL